MASLLAALRRPGPFSLSSPRVSSVSAAPIATCDVSLTHVRRASLMPYAAGITSPPPAPLTLEQARQFQQLKLRRHQVRQSQLEDDQKHRQQRELHQLLAKDLIASRQQRCLDRWQADMNARMEYRQRMDVRKALKLEEHLLQLRLQNVCSFS